MFQVEHRSEEATPGEEDGVVSAVGVSHGMRPFLCKCEWTTLLHCELSIHVHLLIFVIFSAFELKWVLTQRSIKCSFALTTFTEDRIVSTDMPGSVSLHYPALLILD